MMDEGFDSALEQANCVWLLKKTRHNSLSFLTEKYDVASILEGERELISIKQGNRTLAEYHDHFKETFEAVEYSNGRIGVAPALLEFVASFAEVKEYGPGELQTAPTVTARPPGLPQLTEYLHAMYVYQIKMEAYVEDVAAYKRIKEEVAKDLYLGALFVMNTNWERYGSLNQHLENEFVAGHNMYPLSFQDAYNRLESYKTPPRVNHRNMNARNNYNSQGNHVSFLQSNNEFVPGVDVKVFSRIVYQSCGKHGHYKPQRPTNQSMPQMSNQGMQLMQTAAADAALGHGHVMFNQFHQQSKQHSPISKWWVVMDSASSLHSLSNKDLVRDIRKNVGLLDFLTNGGPAFHNMKAKFERGQGGTLPSHPRCERILQS